MAGLCTAFRPRLWTTALMLALVATFVSLGQWQWGKAQRKEAAQAQLDALRDAPPVELPATLVADPGFFQYRRVGVHGQYRAAGQILLDNQMMEEQGERVGYRVLTPLVIDGADGKNATEVLVDRGWVAAGADRRNIPEVAVPPGPTFITGTAVQPSAKHFSLAADTAPPGGNARWQFVDLGRYAREASVELQPLVIRLDPDQPHGYLRAWPRPDDRHERHLSYALQWFGFAASAIGIWAWFGFRRQP
jgi:surfeit locus 1 family protein